MDIRNKVPWQAAWLSAASGCQRKVEMSFFTPSPPLRGLLSVAESVADAFVRFGEPVLHRHALRKAIEKGMMGNEPVTNEGIMEKLEQLSHLGYVWPVGGYAYEPGIRSLMAFVQGYSLSRARRTEAAPHTTPR